MTPTEAVSAHIQQLLEDSSALVTIVGTSISKGRLEEGSELPGIVHSIVFGNARKYVASNDGSPPRMASDWVTFQLSAQDVGDSYDRCYAIIALAEAAIMVSSQQGDKTVYPPTRTLTYERETETLGERYPRVIFEYVSLVAQTVGVGA